MCKHYAIMASKKVEDTTKSDIMSCVSAGSALVCTLQNVLKI